MRRRIDTWLAHAVVALMALLLLDVIWQVVSRFVLRDPSTVTEELARYLLIWLGLLGAAYAAGQGRHLSVDLLFSAAFRSRAARWAEGAFGLVLLVGGLRLVYVQLTLGQTSAAMGVPMGWVYVVIPLAGALFLFYAVDGAPPPPEERD